jgi:hypothetical protein
MGMRPVKCSSRAEVMALLRFEILASWPAGVPAEKITSSTQLQITWWRMPTGGTHSPGLQHVTAATKQKRGKLSPPSKRRVLGLNSALFNPLCLHSGIGGVLILNVD